MDGWRHVAFIDDGLGALTSLRGVASLNLQGCTALTDKGLHALAHMTSLASVNLQDCRQISGARTPSGCLPALPLVHVRQPDHKFCSVSRSKMYGPPMKWSSETMHALMQGRALRNGPACVT